jgi:hypothetical protein
VCIIRGAAAAAAAAATAAQIQRQPSTQVELIAFVDGVACSHGVQPAPAPLDGRLSSGGDYAELSVRNEMMNGSLNRSKIDSCSSRLLIAGLVSHFLPKTAAWYLLK